MLIHINMKLRESEIIGHLAFLLNTKSLLLLHQRLTQIVAGITGEKGRS